MAVRILLADDHQIVREGIKVLLEREEFEVAAEAVNGADAVALAPTIAPDVVILDLTMPILNGLEAAHEILRDRPGSRVILLTMHADDHQVAAALRSGVRAYVLKTQAAEDLAHAIRAVMKGQSYLSPTSPTWSSTGSSPARRRPRTRSRLASARCCSWWRKGRPRKKSPR
jgi:DNA-binding NarL/FixJ family response regulator